MNQAIFYFFALLTVVSALLLITRKNPMHSVLYLAFTVLAIAGVFFSLQAEFLGAIQIMVYAGGIVVLYLFVIIIINLNRMQPERRRFFPKLFLVALPLLLVAEIVVVVLRHPVQSLPNAATGLDAQTLFRSLLSTYLIPFEISSILLLAAMIGAIIVARKRVSNDPRQ